MSALLLSNTRGNTNTDIYDAIKTLIGEKATIAYIPTSADTSRKYFNDVSSFFSNIGDYSLTYFGIFNSDWNSEYIEEISKYDVIYISGGNTYDLMHHIHLRKLEQIIAEFFNNKVVIGTSAGGICLTKKIDISICPNNYNLQDLHGLSLIDFYFYPHFQPTEELYKQLNEYKEKNLVFQILCLL